MEEKEEPFEVIKAEQLITLLFDEILIKEPGFDQEVVEIVKKHLGVIPPHSQAGTLLKDELLELAKKKAGEA